MRALDTFQPLPRRSYPLAAVLTTALLLGVWMLNVAATSHAEENPPTPLGFVYFDALMDPIGETVELHGQMMSEDPNNLTVTFTGAISGTTQTDSGGYFYYPHFGDVNGTVTATVTQGTETVAKTIEI